MGIWRVLKGKIFCENCEKLIATCEFDAADEAKLERLHTWCIDCRKPKEDEIQEDTHE